VTIPNPNLSSPAFKADPFPFYARLRNESPVHPVMMPGKQRAWLITRYDDVVAALRDPRLGKDPLNAMSAEQKKKAPWIPPVFRPLTRNMLDLDPPDHTRLRALVQKVFTPRLIEDLRPRIVTIANELLAAVATKRWMDVIRDFALPLPTIVIAEMLGVPVEDRTKFHRWSAGIVAANWSRWSTIRAVPNVIAFIRYIRKLTKARRRDPRNDLISALVAANEAGDRMSDDELLAMIFLLLIAGHETTVNLIGNGTLALLQNPNQRDRFRNEPALMKSAVEELLRYGSPLETTTERFAAEDVVMHGVTIPRGEMVFAAIASANRDERQFVNPDVLDLARDPNRHVSFGLGIHYCLGAPLARMEGQIAFEAMLREQPRIRLAFPDKPLRWRRGLVLRGLESLPVAW
jgi:cytochrome P450 PksS